MVTTLCCTCPIVQISTQDELAKHANAWLSEPFIGLDVETTLRGRTICLIQIATAGTNYIIDPQNITDLSPLKSVLESDSVVKVIHSAGYESSAFAKIGISISNIYDTCVASKNVHGTKCEGGHSLVAVCKREFDQIVSKECQLSRWDVRPLSAEQIEYAALDAELMCRLYQHFSSQMIKGSGRSADPGKAYHPIQPSTSMKTSNGEILQELQRLAGEKKTAILVYKKPWEPDSTERTVEPYGLKQIEGANSVLMLYAWQIDPESRKPCWRNFRIDRILSVFDGGTPFEPRIPVTITAGEITTWEGINQNEDWKNRLNEIMQDENASQTVSVNLCDNETRYTTLLKESFADGLMTDDEYEVVKTVAARLPSEQLRAANTRFFMLALQDVMLDGTISTNEEKYIRTIRQRLEQLGFCP